MAIAAYDHVREAYQLYNSLLPSQTRKWYDLQKGLLSLIYVHAWLP